MVVPLQAYVFIWIVKSWLLAACKYMNLIPYWLLSKRKNDGRT